MASFQADKGATDGEAFADSLQQKDSVAGLAQQKYYTLTEDSVYAREHEVNAQDEGVSVAAANYTPHPGHRAFRVFSKHTLASAWIAVPDRRGITVEAMKQTIAKEFKNKDGSLLRVKSQQLSYGGMPLVDEWEISDLPPDVIDITLWIRRSVPERMELKARPTVREQEIDFMLHRSQKSHTLEDNSEEIERLAQQAKRQQLQDLEKELCTVHNRRVEVLNINWEIDKSVTTVRVAEEERVLLERGNQMVEFLNQENKRIINEAKFTRTKVQEYLNPLETADELYQEWKEDQAQIDKDISAEDMERKKIQQMVEKRNQRKQARQFVRDLNHYLFFLFTFAVVVFGSRFGNTDSYRFGLTIREALETPRYHLIVDPATMWRYINLDLIPTLYKTKDYNGLPLSPDQQGNVLQFNSIVGGVRLRQVRGKTAQCTHIPKGLESYISGECYTYDMDSQDQTAFESNEERYSWYSEGELEGREYTKGIASYAGGGFVKDLPASNATIAAQMANNLWQYEWTNKMTRAMFVDFSTYNTNINKFTIVRLLFEMPLGGGVIARSEYNTLKLFRYTDIQDFFILAAEIILTGIQCAFVMSQREKIKKFGFFKLLKDVWVLCDWVNMIILWVVLILRIQWLVMVSKVDFLKASQNQYINLMPIAHAVVVENYVNCINTLLMFVRAFRFMNIFPSFSIYRNTLNRTLGMNAVLWLLLLLVMVAYSSAGFVAFGRQVEGFKSPIDSMLTLFEYCAGEYNFKAMSDVNPILGPVFTISYMLLVYLLLMNLFYSILADAYAVEVGTNKDTSDELMGAIRKEAMKTFEPILPFLKPIRVAIEAEEARQKMIEEGILANTEDTNMFKFRLGQLIEAMGKVCVNDLFDQFLPDIPAFLSDPRPRIESKLLEAMQFLAGAAMEDSDNFDKDILSKFSLNVDEVYEKFRLVDVDGGNSLDVDECPAVIELLGIPLDFTPQQELQFFEFLDKDGNGDIDFDEFIEFYQNPDQFIKWFKNVEGVGQRTAKIKEKMVAEALAEAENVEDDIDTDAVKLDAAHLAKRRKQLEEGDLG